MSTLGENSSFFLISIEHSKPTCNYYFKLTSFFILKYIHITFGNIKNNFLCFDISCYVNLHPKYDCYYGNVVDTNITLYLIL